MLLAKIEASMVVLGRVSVGGANTWQEVVTLAVHRVVDRTFTMCMYMCACVRVYVHVK